MALVCDNNGRRRQPLFDTSAIRRAFNSSHSIGLRKNNAAHTVNNLKETDIVPFGIVQRQFGFSSFVFTLALKIRL